MTEFASLRDALDALRESQDEYARAVSRMVTAQSIDSREQWEDIADLREELHGVANRVESLFRTISERTTDVA